MILRFVRTKSDSRPESYIYFYQGVAELSTLSGCVKSALGVATGLIFRIFCASHKKEIELTWISRHG